MRITLDIKDHYYKAFLAVIKKLDYVSVSKDEIAQWQQAEAERRLNQYKNAPQNAEDFDSAIDEIEREL